MTFDFRNPDYIPVFQERMDRLNWMRAQPETRVPALRAYYRSHYADFINDFGITFDPRAVGEGRSPIMPFLLFDKQREWIDWVIERWRAKEPGITEKSRDCGVSWLAVALGASLCLFNRGMVVGYGASLEEQVDASDDPKSLFSKARVFVENLPPEFRGNWNRKTDAPYMRIKFPDTGSAMTGEGGDNIGRGGRTGITFIDESAHLRRPQLIDASLSATTNCRIDISSVNGMGNPFAQKRFGGKISVFVFDWRDDPRKDEAWYAKQREELDPVTLAQEVDRDYAASVEGVLIPGAWIQASIDAHIKLGIAPSGRRRGALDVADEGKDANAFAGAYGFLLEHLEEWSGKDSDIYSTVLRAFHLCDDHGYDEFLFDSDGLGAGVRGDARVINEKRARKVAAKPFRGSESPHEPEREDEKGRKNKDFFANQKAQAWWALRKRFQTTYRAVNGQPYDPDGIISISSGLACLGKLTGELTQPTYSLNLAGKIVVDKVPDGAKSPNLADAVMIAYSHARRVPMRINQAALRQI